MSNIIERKQKIHFITYGDDKFKNSLNRIKKEALETRWFDTITSLTPDVLDEDFKNKFSNILQMKRGGGFWIWKPYIIKKILNIINDNDILVYADSGCTINIKGSRRFFDYINMLNSNDSGIISFQSDSWLEKQYTTNEIFNYFNINNQEIKDSGQIIATSIILKKNENSLKIINQAIDTLYKNPLLYTDYYNNYEQNDEFIDNRHDQSILSILRKINKSIILKDETNIFVSLNPPKFSDLFPILATRIRI